MFTTLEGAIALLMFSVLVTTCPVFAHDHSAPTAHPTPHGQHGEKRSHGHHHGADAPVTPGTTVLLGKHVFRVGGQSVEARLYDARAYFDELHRAHPNHPGIPTHRLVLVRSSSLPVSLSSVLVTGPDGSRRESPLTQDGVRWVADLEWKSPGTYHLTLAGVPGDHAFWSYTLKP